MKTDSLAERSLHAIEPLPVAYPAELRQIRKILDLTQKQISELLGVTMYTWWRWESGDRPISETYTKLVRDLLQERRPTPGG